MRKVFVMSAMIGSLMIPVTVSTALAEDEHFLKRQSEGMKQWHEYSQKRKQTLDDQFKALHEHQAMLKKRNEEIRDRVVKYQNNGRKSTQEDIIPNEWYDINQINE